MQIACQLHGSSLDKSKKTHNNDNKNKAIRSGKNLAGISS
jgi:hypothetical protein